MGKGSSGSQSSTQTTTPWGPQGKRLQEIYKGAHTSYARDELGQVAPQSDATQFAQNATINRALGGGVTDQALGLAGQTLGGEYLNSQNPDFQAAIQYGLEPAQQSYMDAVNSVGSGFSSAGAFGSGAHAAQRNRVDDTFARHAAGAGAQAGAQNYENERQRMQQAMTLAPGLDQAGYAGLDRIAGVGADQDAYNQAQLDTPYRALQQYNSIVSGTPTFGTSTGNQRQSGGGGSALAGGLGAAMSILPFAAMAFSDERLKTDIKHVGKLQTGEKLYSYRYKGDPSGKIHFGPMAQELEKTQPETVHEIGGFKAVDYGQVAANQQPKAFL